MIVFIYCKRYQPHLDCIPQNLSDSSWYCLHCWLVVTISIMLKAAWHWGSDSSVINDPLGEPVHTPLYVGLLFAWGSVDSDRMFSLFSLEGSLTGNSDGYK
jgi:hypothetical protein